MNWINKIENFFLKAEQFFNSVHFIPRLLTAFKVGMVAFNDELFKDSRQRKFEIQKRKKEIETVTEQSPVTETTETTGND